MTVVPNPGFAFTLSTMITQTAGTIFVMWLGEQITERGIGNGISLIIFIGIIGAHARTTIARHVRAAAAPATLTPVRGAVIAAR